MTRWTSRSIHSAVALPIIAPLLLTILTGFTYRFTRNVLHYDKSTVQWLLSLHTMSLVGLGAVYPLLVTSAVVVAAVTGVPLSSMGTVWRRLMAGNWDVVTGVIGLPTTLNARVVHRAVTATVMLPLLVTALTGAVWTVQQYYLGHTRSQLAYLMSLHQGDFTGSVVVYTGVLLVLTLIALGTGGTLIPPPSSSTASGAVRAAPTVPTFFKNATTKQ